MRFELQSRMKHVYLGCVYWSTIRHGTRSLFEPAQSTLSSFALISIAVEHRCIGLRRRRDGAPGRSWRMCHRTRRRLCRTSTRPAGSCTPFALLVRVAHNGLVPPLNCIVHCETRQILQPRDDETGWHKGAPILLPRRFLPARVSLPLSPFLVPLRRKRRKGRGSSVFPVAQGWHTCGTGPAQLCHYQLSPCSATDGSTAPMSVHVCSITAWDDVA